MPIQSEQRHNEIDLCEWNAMSTCHLMNFINMHIPCIESNAWILNLKIYRLLFRCEIPLCTPLHYILVIWSNFSEWKMMSKFSTRRIWKSMNINWQWHIQISQSYNNYIVISRASLFTKATIRNTVGSRNLTEPRTQYCLVRGSVYRQMSAEFSRFGCAPHS